MHAYRLCLLLLALLLRSLLARDGGFVRDLLVVRNNGVPAPKQGDHGHGDGRDDPGAATAPPLFLGEWLSPRGRCRGRIPAGEGRGAGGSLRIFSRVAGRCTCLGGSGACLRCVYLRGVARVRHVAHLEDVARAGRWLDVTAARGVVVFRVRAHDFLRSSGNVQARMSLLEV